MRGDPDQTPLLVEVESVRGRTLLPEPDDVKPTLERARSPYSYKPPRDAEPPIAPKLAPEKSQAPPRSSGMAPNNKGTPQTARARFVEYSSDESDDASSGNNVDTRRRPGVRRTDTATKGAPGLRASSLRREALVNSEASSGPRGRSEPSSDYASSSRFADSSIKVPTESVRVQKPPREAKTDPPTQNRAQKMEPSQTRVMDPLSAQKMEVPRDSSNIRMPKMDPVTRSDQSSPHSPIGRVSAGPPQRRGSNSSVGLDSDGQTLSTSLPRAATLGAEMADYKRERRRSRSRTLDDSQTRPAFSDDKRALAPPPCPRPEAIAGLDDWYTLDRAPDFSLCPDCRHAIFGRGYETTLQRRNGTKRARKVRCAMNDPWNRLACVLAFKQQKRPIKQLLAMPSLTDDIVPCPESRPAEGRDWYHLRDTETGHSFQDFQICAHCVESIDIVFPMLQSIFHASKEIKEARVCSLRSDAVRFGKYLNFLVEMNAKAAERRPAEIKTSDLIWEIKWLTVISPCQRASKYSGSDWHVHRRLPQLTICEECYYQVVRPVLRQSSRGRIAHEVSPEAKEIVGPTSCKLYSARMRQVFEDACEDDDWEALESAVIKRSELSGDIDRLKMELERSPGNQDLRTAVEHYEAKWRRLERRHE